MPWVSIKKAKELNIPHKTLQTVELPKNKFTIKEAKEWLNKHHFASAYYRKTTNYLRFMQTPPIIGAVYYSKKLPRSGIILVYQKY